MDEKLSKNDSENKKLFITVVCSKLLKRNFSTSKTDVYCMDGIWSLHIFDLKDYGPENNRGYGYVLVVIDSFSKFDWTTPLISENAQTMKDSREKQSIYFQKEN